MTESEGTDYCTACLADYDAMTSEQRASHGCVGEMVAITCVEMSRLRDHAPPLCGRCSCCVAAGDTTRRISEYLANLDDDEPATLAGAMSWLRRAYPTCDQMRAQRAVQRLRDRGHDAWTIEQIVMRRAMLAQSTGAHARLVAMRDAAKK